MDNLIIYNTDDGKSNVALLVADHEAWLTQNQLAELFATSVPNIATHIKNIREDKELHEISVIKDFLITARLIGWVLTHRKKWRVKTHPTLTTKTASMRWVKTRPTSTNRFAKTLTTQFL